MKKKKYRYWVPSTQRASGDLIPSRETTARWLWERPQLLGWECSLQWLFEHGWLLTGIDEAGGAIIAAAMIAGGKDPGDPFRGLVDYARGCSREEWTAPELRAKWTEYLKPEEEVGPRVLPPIVKPGYTRAVEQFLAAREVARNPLPTFAALVASRNSEFEYSEAGLKNRLLLENLVGADKVRLRVVSGTLGLNGLLVQSWSPRARTSAHWGRPYEQCQ
jgi:hypothetical protein